MQKMENQTDDNMFFVPSVDMETFLLCNNIYQSNRNLLICKEHIHYQCDDRVIVTLKF